MGLKKDELQQHDAATREERAQLERSQRELDRLGATLKQVEAYNEQVGGKNEQERRARTVLNVPPVRKVLSTLRWPHTWCSCLTAGLRRMLHTAPSVSCGGPWDQSLHSRWRRPAVNTVAGQR